VVLAVELARPHVVHGLAGAVLAVDGDLDAVARRFVDHRVVLNRPRVELRLGCVQLPSTQVRSEAHGRGEEARHQRDSGGSGSNDGLLWLGFRSASIRACLSYESATRFG